MHRGYVKLWRKSMDSAVWKNQNMWRLWTWCLMKATHKGTSEMVGYQLVELQPGQFVFGRKRAAQETGLSERTIRTCLVGLQKLGNLTIKATNKFSVLTIEKWEDYQSADQQTTNKATSKRPASDQQATTNKNDKNKRTKEEHTPYSPPLGEQPPAPPEPHPCQDAGAYEFSMEFLQFWEAYPKKVGQVQAWIAWKTLAKQRTHPGLSTLLAAIAEQSQSEQWTKNRGQYIPSPANWLGGMRWTDSLEDGADDWLEEEEFTL